MASLGVHCSCAWEAQLTCSTGPRHSYLRCLRRGLGGERSPQLRQRTPTYAIYIDALPSLGRRDHGRSVAFSASLARGHQGVDSHIGAEQPSPSPREHTGSSQRSASSASKEPASSKNSYTRKLRGGYGKSLCLLCTKMVTSWQFTCHLGPTVGVHCVRHQTLPFMHLKAELCSSGQLDAACRLAEEACAGATPPSYTNLQHVLNATLQVAMYERALQCLFSSGRWTVRSLMMTSVVGQLCAVA